MATESWPSSVELCFVKVMLAWLLPPTSAVIVGAAPLAAAAPSPPAVTAVSPLPKAAKLVPWRVAVNVDWSLLELAIRRTEVAATSLWALPL